MMLNRLSLVPVFFVAMTFLSVAAPADDVVVGPIDFPVTIVGVKATVPISGTLTMATEGGSIAVALTALADLSDLQAKVTAIAQALDLPKDNCARHDLNPVVDKINTASIEPGPDGTILVSIGGHVTLWLCAKVFGKEVKTKVGSDDVTLSGSLRLVTNGSSTARLELVGDATIDASSTLEAVAGLFKGQISDALRKAIGPGLDLRRAGASITELLGRDLHIDEAAFGAEGDDVLLTAKVRARLDGAQLTKLLSAGK